MKKVIEVKNLSKKYTLNPSGRAEYLALRDVAANLISNPLKFLSNESKKNAFWALKNINFYVREGEVLGIVGPNGAGKSTLLKILTRITPPTIGSATLRGRVASLLEVGTGFHPELTGRENVFLNGAILGMKRSEVKKKFDEIVVFAGVEKFIDTPVKYFSSGMQVRLAFSVAAHLDSDILLVDEVLSVGDAEFQKKSLGKMESVRKQGRTVLFVSHNLSAIASLCQRALLLKSGRIVSSGSPELVISEYLRRGQGILPEVDCSKDKRFSDDFAKMLRIRAHDISGKTLDYFDIRKPIGITIDYQVLNPNIVNACNVQLNNMSGIIIFNSPENPDIVSSKIISQETGSWSSTCWIPGNFLAEGLFTIRATLTSYDGKKLHEIDFPEAISFNVYDNVDGTSVRGKSIGEFPGVIRPKLRWKRVKLTSILKKRVLKKTALEYAKI